MISLERLRVQCGHLFFSRFLERGWTDIVLEQNVLRRTLGVLWLIDAILQVQPQMFTVSMIDSVLLPTLNAQPAPVASSLYFITQAISQHLVFFNLLIAIVQAEIGLLLITGLWAGGTVIFSVVWALIVWYGGEGMNLLLTGQSSVLTGAPGAVLLYPVVGLLVYPWKASSAPTEKQPLLRRIHACWVLASFWIFAALLQLQPFWWQQGQIAQVIGSMTGLGKLNSVLIDPVMVPLASLLTPFEAPLNSALVVIFLGLGIGLAFVKPEQSRFLLVLSILLSLLIWWATQGFGMIFTGLATDFNSGLLIVLMTLACWPKFHALPQSAVQPPNQTLPAGKRPEKGVQLANPTVL